MSNYHLVLQRLKLLPTLHHSDEPVLDGGVGPLSTAIRRYSFHHIMPDVVLSLLPVFLFNNGHGGRNCLSIEILEAQI